MFIDLSHTLRCRDVVPPNAGNNHEFLRLVTGAKKLHYVSSGHVFSSRDEYPVPTASLAIRAMNTAFDNHLNLSLTPDLFWYLIVHEVATHIKMQPERYARMFTATPEQRQEIHVRDDSLVRGDPQNNWGRTINLFRQPLVKAVSEETADLFMANFCTTSPQDEIAILLAFMDTCSKFYKYVVHTRCGIRGINLLGTAEDYSLIISKTDRLARAFPALKSYFRGLSPVLRQIHDTFSWADPDFWANIYKYNQESGTDFVTGWVNKFMAYRYTERGPVEKDDTESDRTPRVRVDNFPSHVSSVPFKWDYYGQMIPMIFAGGVIGVDYIDDKIFGEHLLEPHLGFSVLE